MSKKLSKEEIAKDTKDINQAVDDNSPGENDATQEAISEVQEETLGITGLPLIEAAKTDPKLAEALDRVREKMGIVRNSVKQAHDDTADLMQMLGLELDDDLDDDELAAD